MRFNLNSDGSFMSFEQIILDIMVNRMNSDLQTMLVHDFDPPVSQEEAEASRYTGLHVGRYARMQFGMWIRNSYGLWESDNPHTMLQLDESRIKDGVDHHPCHPDNFSGDIIDRLVARFRTPPNLRQML